MVGRTDLSRVPAGLSLEPGNGFFQIFGVEVQSVLRRIAMVDAANSEVDIGGEDGSLQSDAVADLPPILFGERDIDDGAGAIMLPGFQLILRDDFVGSYLQIFVWIGGELGEEVLRPVIDVAAAEPRDRSDRIHSRNGSNFFAIESGKKECQRDAITNDQATRSFGSDLVDVERAPDADHHGQQQQREADADHGQQAAAFIPKCITNDETAECHTSPDVAESIHNVDLRCVIRRQCRA